MTVASQLQRLIDSKAAIKTAIEGKGVPVDASLKLDSYASKIDLISQGGGEVYNPPDPNCPPAPLYVRPADWIDISDCPINEMNFLMTNISNGFAINVTVANSGTYSVDWGDGVIQTGITSNTSISHRHTTGGTWCSEGYFMWKVRVWATNNITQYFNPYPSGFINTTSNLISPVLWMVINTPFVTQHNSRLTNYNWTYLKEVEFKSFDNCTMANATLSGGKNIRKVTLPSTWGKATNVSGFFNGCYSLIEVNLPESWGLVTNTQYMFSDCRSLTNITLPTSWGLVTDNQQMFYQCYMLRNLTLPTSWGNVTNCSNMLYGCKNIFELELPESWGNVTNCSGFFTITGIKKITLPVSWGNVTTCYAMFQNCPMLRTVNLPASWSNVKNCGYMFYNDYSLSNITLPTTWSQVNDVQQMFYSCYLLQSVNLPASWGFIVTTQSMFYGCSLLQSINLPASWGSVSNAYQMFYNCISLRKLTLPASCGLITSFYYFAPNCYSLEEVTLPTQFSSVLSNCTYMFQNCLNLKTVNNAEYLGSDTVQVDYYQAYVACFSIESITIGSRLTRFSMYGGGSINTKLNLTSLRLTNQNSTFTGSSPQINVSYTSLGQAALVQLFNDLPTLSGKTINITGCTGASALTAAERAIATGKGWTIVG